MIGHKLMYRVNGTLSCHHSCGAYFEDLHDVGWILGPKSGDELLAQAKTLRPEFVVLVRGTVSPRPEGQENLKHATGAIELRCNHLEVLNKSKTPPFTPGQTDLPGEDRFTGANPIFFGFQR